MDVMTDFQAVIYGIVQGLTEFLPVSSSAHLRIIPALLHWPDAGAAYTAVIQWGTLLAALIYFRKEIVAILFDKKLEGSANTAESSDVNPAKDNVVGRHLLLPIIIGSIPIAVLGLAFKHRIEHDFRNLYIVAGSMITFAIFLGLAETRSKAKREIGTITIKDGLIVGLAQACSLVPGASRSGSTIMGALFIGLERSTAARFSFLLGLPAIFAAGLKELLDAVKESKHSADWTAYQHSAMHAKPLIIAIVVSFIVGWLSIDWLIKFLKKNTTHAFIIYRVILGLFLIGMLSSGKLSATDDAPATATSPAPSSRGSFSAPTK